MFNQESEVSGNHVLSTELTGFCFIPYTGLYQSPPLEVTAVVHVVQNVMRYAHLCYFNTNNVYYFLKEDSKITKKDEKINSSVFHN